MAIELNLEVARTALSARHMTQTKLASIIGVNRQSMCRIMAGKQAPSEQLARRMAEALGIELEQMVAVADGMYVLTELEATMLKVFRKLPMIEKATLLAHANKTLMALESGSGDDSSPTAKGE